MWIPLVVLAVLSVVGGAINLPFSHDTELPRCAGSSPCSARRPSTTSTATKVVLAVDRRRPRPPLGIAIGWNAWRRADRPELEPELLRRAWYVDPLYQAVIAPPGPGPRRLLGVGVDRKVVDGAVNGVAVAVREGGSQLRRAADRLRAQLRPRRGRRHRRPPRPGSSCGRADAHADARRRLPAPHAHRPAPRHRRRGRAAHAAPATRRAAADRRCSSRSAPPRSPSTWP